MCELKAGDMVRVKNDYVPAILQGEIGVILFIENNIAAIDFGREYGAGITWELDGKSMLQKPTGRFIANFFLELVKPQNDLEVELL